MSVKTTKQPLPAAPGRRPAAPVRPKRQSFGPKAVGSFVPGLTKKAFEKFGFSAATLLTDWASIVGPDIATYTMPDKLKWPRNVEFGGEEPDDGQRGRPGATLMLRVDGARALEIQYKGSQILERINAYFGYRAVSNLRIIQAPIGGPAGADRPQYRKLEPLKEAPPEIAGVSDDGLRHALELMAAGLKSSRKRPASSGK